MKRKIKALFSDRSALFAALILIAVVVFCIYAGIWIKTNIG